MDLWGSVPYMACKYKAFQNLRIYTEPPRETSSKLTRRGFI